MLSVLRADTFVTSFIHSFIHSPPAGVQKISALALQHKQVLAPRALHHSKPAVCMEVVAGGMERGAVGHEVAWAREARVGLAALSRKDLHPACVSP